MRLLPSFLVLSGFFFKQHGHMRQAGTVRDSASKTASAERYMHLSADGVLLAEVHFRELELRLPSAQGTK